MRNGMQYGKLEESVLKQRRLGSARNIVVAALTAVAVVLTTPGAANAAYYSTYSDVADLRDSDGMTSTQGFAVGSTYTYSIKQNDSTSMIYRTKMSDGSTTVMTNVAGAQAVTWITGLGHANDIALASLDGNLYMYIVTADKDSGSYQLVKLEYNGTTYRRVASYYIWAGGEALGATGVKITSQDTSRFHFLFKYGHTFYRAWVSNTLASGSTIYPSLEFSVDVAHALVNGSTVDGIETWPTQGIGYDGTTLYYALTSPTAGNVSVVLVYREIPSAANGVTVNADPSVSFRITSQAFPDLCEIEGVDVGPDRTLWFNANRRKTSTDVDHDVVAHFPAS